MFVKSGTDFQNFSEIELWQYSSADYQKVVENSSTEVSHKQVETGHAYIFKMPQNRVVVIKKHDILKKDISDPQIELHCQNYNAKLEEQMKKVIEYITRPCSSR